MATVYKSEINKFNVHFYPNFLNKDDANKYFNILNNHVVYNSKEESQITVYGKKFYIPRSQVGYGDLGTYYEFSGTKVTANPWCDGSILGNALLELKNKVELVTGKKFNFVLINKYNDGNDNIGHHRDNEAGLEKEPAIAGISFGQPRDIIFKPYKFIPIKDNLPLHDDKLSLILNHGSMYVMMDKTNIFWTHGIPVRKSVKGVRISLTFRLLI